MRELVSFRNAVHELYRRCRPYDDNRHPTQRDLADAVGLHPTELSNRLNGNKGARLTDRDVRAIVRTLAEWGALRSHDEANALLALASSQPLTASELVAPPFDQLIPTNPEAATSHELSPQRHNLPRQLTSFIGRAEDCNKVMRLIANSPLVSIVGPGGAGKTRLALAVAERISANFAAGVWLVELGGIVDARLLPDIVARTLGLRESPTQDALSQLTNELAERKLLLVLDNCEHLTQAVAELCHHLLINCRQLHILTTSRELLRVEGEVAWLVQGLSMPPRHAETIEQLEEYEAVQLFLARATVADPDFQIAASNTEALRSICTALDGLPLAIELAAARLRLMSVDEVAARIANRFQLLRGGLRTAAPRQQTLEALLDWSYNLLGLEEQMLLRWLGVFSGPFTTAAAESLAQAAGIGGATFIEHLGALVDKSLLIRDQGGCGLRMLETVREYARSRLSAAELEAARRAHLDYYLQLASTAASELLGGEQRYWLEILENEHDNLRTALLAASEIGDLTKGLKLAILLGRFWSIHSHLSEARRTFEALLSQAMGTPDALQARAMYIAGNLAADQSDYPRARELLAHSLEVRRNLDDPPALAQSLDSLGRVLLYQDDYPVARMLLSESLSLKRALGNQQAIANTLSNLGKIATYQGRYQGALPLLDEALNLNRALSNDYGAAIALYDLGELYQDWGKFELAQEYYHAAAPLAEAVGYKSLTTRVLYGQGYIAYSRGDYRRAEGLFAASLELAQELGDQADLVVARSGVAKMALQCGDLATALAIEQDNLELCRKYGYRRQMARTIEAIAALTAAPAPEEAARLLGCARQLRSAIGAPLPEAYIDEEEHLCAQLTARLGEQGFKAHLQEGGAGGPQVYARHYVERGG